MALGALATTAFAVAALAAVLAAVVPALPSTADLPRTLVASPPGTWRLDGPASGPLGPRLFERWGLTPEQRQAFVADNPGFARSWYQPGTGLRAQGIVVQTPDSLSSARSLANQIVPAQRSAAPEFPVAEVDGARGFVFDIPASGVRVTRVVFRRDRFLFLFSIVDVASRPDLARAVAQQQDRRTPAGEDEPYDAVEAMGRLAGAATSAIAVYLLIVSGGAGLRIPRRRRRAQHEPAADPSAVAVRYVDVSPDVTRRRRVARAAFTAKLLGAGMTVPLFDPVLWPNSLAIVVPGLLIVACGFGLDHGRRLAARVLLGVSGVLALMILTLPFALAIGPGALAVVRRQVPPPERVARRASRYRRLFTGRHVGRVTGLLAAAALLTVVGLASLMSGVLMPGDVETDTRRQLGALACLGLAVLPYRRARRHAAPQAASVVERDPRAPILYLRSFGDDELKVRTHGGGRRHAPLERFGYRGRERFEEVIAGCLWAYGPVVAVGAPGERLVPLGAARTNFDNASWQAGVETWLVRAGLIVISVGQTTGLRWEISRVAELGLWDRTILLFSPSNAAELEERWRFVTATAAQAGVQLSPDLAAEHVLTATAAGGTLVAYTGAERDEWHYESALRAAAGARRDPSSSPESGRPQPGHRRVTSSTSPAETPQQAQPSAST